MGRSSDNLKSQILMFIDSHAHLDVPNYDIDRAEVIDRAHQAGVEMILEIAGSDVAKGSLDVGLKLAEDYPSIFAAVGVHPHEASIYCDEIEEVLLNHSKHPKVIGWGEIGLDYYYDNSPRDIQRKVFHRQIELSLDCGLPVIIHTRDAEEDTIRILRESWFDRGGSKFGGIIHCFTGTQKLADAAIEMGFHISFSGVITFKSADELRTIAGSAPMNKLLIETDCPFLAPVPHRGKRNEPAYIIETAALLAEIKDVSTEDIAHTTSDNFRKLFKL